jgi:hypothetical protein
MELATNNKSRGVISVTGSLADSFRGLLARGSELPSVGVTFIMPLEEKKWLVVPTGIIRKMRAMSNGEKFSIIFSKDVPYGTVVDNSDDKFTNLSMEGVPDEVIFE